MEWRPLAVDPGFPKLAAPVSAALDELAEALGRARTAHEARPGDRERERRFLAARCAWLEADRARVIEDLKRANGRLALFRGEIKRVQRDFGDRMKALIARTKPRRRARLGADAGAPLFEGGGE